MKAVVYTRISNDRAGDAAGVTRQERECREMAKARGWSIAQVFTDNDVSAYSGRRRPQYEAMLGAIERGEVGAVVAWHPDRLHRSPIELEQFIDIIEKRKVAVATVTAGHYDLSTPSGRMTARVVGNVARYESEHKAERHRAKGAELARSGKPGGGGSRPFGFESDRITHNKPEAKEIRRAAATLLAGGSSYSVIVDWNHRAISTTTGGDWKPSVFRRLILSPRIAGLREHRGEIVGPAVWKPIITEADHYALRALFNDPSRRPESISRAYLLTGGIGTCGLCGAKLVARPKDGGRRSYVCASGPGFNGCGKIRQLSDPLEDLVRDMICETIAGPALAEAIARVASEDPEQATTVVEVRDLEASLEQLARDHYAEGLLTRQEFFAARDSVKARLDVARSSLATRTATPLLDSIPTEADALSKLWDSQPMEWRRQLTVTLIDQVILRAAVRGRNFFDPARVSVVWKF